MGATADELPIRRLLDAGRALVGELSTESVLRRVLEAARQVTGARYAAVGVLDASGTELDSFLTSGIDTQAHSAIDTLPRGRGVLGLLIEEAKPLRLRNIASHPRSYGFPTGHPPMRSFLGVPILVRGQAWGNLYLTEKPGGEFTEIDQEDVETLASWAAVAIDNARQFELSEQRRQELERAVRALQSWRDIMVAIGAETGVEKVLELIVKRGRALVGARSVVIMLRDGDELVVAAAAGEGISANAQRIPVSGSSSGAALERDVAFRVSNVARDLRISPAALGVTDAHTALLVPMRHRGSRVGVLAAFDRGEEGAPFRDVEEQLLETFAASAANAVAMARTVESDRLRASLAAAEAERARWARELHDETLQGLGSLRLLLSGSLRRGEPAAVEEAAREAVGHLTREIDSLRGLITELRPAALDQLGLQAALEALIERHQEVGALTVEAHLELPDAARLAAVPELATAVYRLVQEALTNVVKHAHARRVTVEVRAGDSEVHVDVSDDGVGFDPAMSFDGYGLKGMRERVTLVGGTLRIAADRGGTRLAAAIPLPARSSTTRAPAALLAAPGVSSALARPAGGAGRG